MDLQPLFAAIGALKVMDLQIKVLQTVLEPFARQEWDGEMYYVLPLLPRRDVDGLPALSRRLASISTELEGMAGQLMALPTTLEIDRAVAEHQDEQARLRAKLPTS